MARGRDRQQWNHTASLIAALFNSRPLSKGGARAKPEQFHPYLRGKSSPAKGTRLTKHTLKFLALAMGAEGVPT
jgi:hypothetical protein